MQPKSSFQVICASRQVFDFPLARNLADWMCLIDGLEMPIDEDLTRKIRQIRKTWSSGYLHKVEVRKKEHHHGMRVVAKATADGEVVQIPSCSVLPQPQKTFQNVGKPDIRSDFRKR